jgi:hypothetical protein
MCEGTMISHEQVVRLQIARHNARSGHSSDVDALAQIMVEMADELIGAAIAYVAVSEPVEMQPDSGTATTAQDCNQRDGGGCDYFERGSGTHGAQCEGDGHYQCKECVRFGGGSSTGEDEAAAIMLDARAPVGSKDPDLSLLGIDIEGMAIVFEQGDMDLITAYRTAAPALAREVQRLREELDAARGNNAQLQPVSSPATDAWNCNQRDGGGCDHFERGKPDGHCSGDGHYECKECELFCPAKVSDE